MTISVVVPIYGVEAYIGQCARSLLSQSWKDTEFVFVIPPTTFENGFKVTVIDEAGDVFEKSSSRSLAISRNKMESMGAMKVTPAPVPEPVIYKIVTSYEELTEGSEIIIVSTAYDKAMATEMWSSPLRKEADITKSSDKTVVENPGVDVQVFTLKKGSADNTVMFECKNGEFAGQYIGAKLTANPTDLSWKYLFNCTSATTERGISFNVDLQRNGDALIGPFDTQNNYKYMSSLHFHRDKIHIHIFYIIFHFHYIQDNSFFL